MHQLCFVSLEIFNIIFKILNLFPPPISLQNSDMFFRDPICYAPTHVVVGKLVRFKVVVNRFFEIFKKQHVSSLDRSQNFRYFSEKSVSFWTKKQSKWSKMTPLKMRGNDKKGLGSLFLCFFVIKTICQKFIRGEILSKILI